MQDRLYLQCHHNQQNFDQRLIAQTLSFKEGIATIIRLRMTLYTVEAPSFMEGRMSTFDGEKITEVN